MPSLRWVIKLDCVGNGFIRSAIGALSGQETRTYKISLCFAYKYLNFALFNSELRIPNYELTLQASIWFFTAPIFKYYYSLAILMYM